MKRKHNGGYSLIEVLIAMAVLGIVTIPTTSALLTAHRMNVKADAMLQAQLQVSSAVEVMMAEGIKTANIGNDAAAGTDQKYKLPDDIEATAVVNTNTDPTDLYYQVTVSSGDVQVVTYIRAAD